MFSQIFSTSVNGIMLLNEVCQIPNGGHVSSCGMQTKVWSVKANDSVGKTTYVLDMHAIRVHTCVLHVHAVMF